MANDAFGKSYFLQLALAGASLWPAALALAWMNTRFAEVEFPFAWTSFHVGYVTPFILLYIVARILFKAVKPHIPYFRYINSILDTYKDKPASDTARESPTSTSREK
jgi:hypothetical protein